MTLCMAWKQGKEIYFASDSRLTNNELHVIADDCNKVFKIDVQAIGTNDEHGTPPSILFHTTFGMCFSGSYLNGSNLSDTISEFLSNMQGAPEISDFSAENISNIAFEIYKQVSKQFMAIHGRNGLARVFFGGYCPETQAFKLYKFNFDPPQAEQELQFNKEEIELGNYDPVFIGDESAINKAIELQQKIGNNYSYFHLIREIIKDTTILTVGGNIQVGKFTDGEFRTVGVAHYTSELNEYDMETVQDTYNFRGININMGANKIRQGQINFTIPLMNPFEHERNELFKRIMDNLNSE